MRKAIAVVLMMTVASVASAGSVAVDNASWETGDFTDWIINAAGLDSVRADGTPWPAAFAPDGAFYAYLRGNNPHYMYQDTVPIDEAETYTLEAYVGVQHTWS